MLLGLIHLISNKKGDIAWDEIGKLVLILIAIVVILAGIIALTGSSGELFNQIKNIFRMGK